MARAFLAIILVTFVLAASSFMFALMSFIVSDKMILLFPHALQPSGLQLHHHIMGLGA